MPGVAADDPGYQELHERLRELALSRTSNTTDNEVKISVELARPATCSIETQTEILEVEETKLNTMISTGQDC